MAAVAALAAGASITSSLGTAGMQIYGNSLNNQQQLSNANSMADRAEGAYTSAGLPKYLAWSDSSSGNSLPGQRFQVAGANFYSAGPVNSNLPVYSTSASQMTHNSTPRPNANIRPPEQFNVDGNNIEMNQRGRINFVPGLGQNDRMGLGFGRYNGPNNMVQGGPMLANRPRDAAMYQNFARALQ